MDFILLREFFEAFESASNDAGIIGALATCILFGIRLVRMDFVQNSMPESLQWINWPPWVKWAIPFVLAMAGTILLEIQAGKPPWAALAAAFAAAVAATTTHGITKAIGQSEQGAKLRRNPLYRPGNLRKAASLVLPLKPKDQYPNRVYPC